MIPATRGNLLRIYPFDQVGGWSIEISCMNISSNPQVRCPKYELRYLSLQKKALLTRFLAMLPVVPGALLSGQDQFEL